MRRSTCLLDRRHDGVDPSLVRSIQGPQRIYLNSLYLTQHQQASGLLAVRIRYMASCDHYFSKKKVGITDEREKKGEVCMHCIAQHVTVRRPLAWIGFQLAQVMHPVVTVMK